MSQVPNFNLFISYSHLDEVKIKEFIKHLAPLKNNGLIKDWYDRKILAGQDFQDTIDNNLDKAEIICLFISANFLDSSACIREQKRALELRKKKGVSVIPIILSACGWLDDKDICHLLAIPTDGKPVTSFSDSDTAWNLVYNEIKRVIEDITKIKNLKITEEFLSFLKSSELLSKAHSQKSEVLIDDIFIFPELTRYDDLLEYEKKVSSEKLIHDFLDYSKILIAGEDQSGKTTLCKKIFTELRIKNFVPVYITDKLNQFQGSIDSKIIKSFKEQYSNIEFEDIDRKRIVPIIDDFHFAKYKEKILLQLNGFCYQFVFVDDIFSLNFKDENLLKLYKQFKIKEFSPTLRNSLIEKWIHLTDKDIISDKNKIYKEIDHSTELVNSTLGKVFSSGIMPAYPFFILTILSTHETFEKPLDKEITSQGYCYQALIYLYLRKNGVKNDEIDTYINFLTEIAFYFYKQKKIELTEADFNDFLKSYLDKFNLPIKQDKLISNLQKTRIIAFDCFGNYSFCYSYLYYFFVAKYLAEHRTENAKTIDYLINNLHVNENAYIAIFISHHSKSAYILDEIILNAMCLFDKYKPATLSKNELSFFDNQIDNIVKAVLPNRNTSPEQERERRLKAQDIAEEIESKNKDLKAKDSETNEIDDELAIELRRSIKTVEVMGSIIRNRAGSLEKTVLENVFSEAMNVHLKILTSFFELIKTENQQSEIVEFISNRLEEIIKGKLRTPSNEELKKLSKTIFWNMNFSVVYGLVNKIIHSLGSNKLINIIEKVCDNNNTPASFLVKHGILMWYYKNLQIDNIVNGIEDDEFSETANRIMKFMIVNHCSVHTTGYKEIQKIEHKLGIPSKRLLPRNTNK
jgi:hypothetical protein